MSQPVSIRKILLLRVGVGSANKKALAKGWPITLPAEWWASHFRPDAHPNFPESWASAPVWRLNADDTLTPLYP